MLSTTVGETTLNESLSLTTNPEMLNLMESFSMISTCQKQNCFKQPYWQFGIPFSESKPNMIKLLIKALGDLEIVSFEI